jgi:outer membrane protein OmpA-like peptidoglycan-associated protein
MRLRLMARYVAVFAALILGVLVVPPARASGGFPISESFQNTTAPGWNLGGSAILTANGPDSPGTGWLRLTPATGSQAGYAYYNTAFSSSNGALVEFDYATYGGNGADGLTFFLFDGTTSAAQFRIGAFGGSLGYAGCGGTPGLRNAYIGVGFDEFGNFTNLASCGLDGSSASPNRVTVRGAESNAYQMLTGASIPGGLTGDRSNSRHVTVAVKPDGKLTVTIRFPDGTFQTVTSDFQLPAAPATLKLGYAASTGGFTNIHEVRTPLIVKPTDLVTTVTDGVAGASRSGSHAWTATVTNNGPNPTEGEAITATTGAQSLTNVTWTCAATGGASCGTSSGVGLPSAVSGGAMPIGSTLIYTITGDPAAGTDYAEMTVTATPTGDTGDLSPADNTATDTTDLTPAIPSVPTFSLSAGGTATSTLSTPVRGGNISTTRQWQRCDADGSNCVDISGETGATYATTTSDRGKTIRVRQRSTNAAGTTIADSAVYGPLPTTTITNQPPAQSAAPATTFQFTSTNGSGYECRLDGGAWATCTSPRNLSGLADGSHTFDVRAVFGGLSDPTPESVTWVVDTAAPDTTISSTPPSLSASRSASLPFTGSDGSGTGVASYECQIDGGLWIVCTSPMSLTSLTDGAHTFRVRAIDNVGLVDPTPASYSWTVDASAPDTTITSAPAAQVATSSASIAFTGTDGSGSGVASYECRLDGGAWTACTSPRSLTGLADGSHTFAVRAIDNVGNTDATPATRTWVVDTAEPDTTIATHPAANEPTNVADFTFSGDDGSGSGIASLECRIDSGAWGACTSPSHVSGLTEGDHTYQVRAIDQAGNVDSTPASFTWHVDSTAPPAPVVVAPADASVTALRRPVLRFTAEPGAHLAITLDGQVLATVTVPVNGTVEYTPLFDLIDGPHTVTAAATDDLGNAGPAATAHTFRVLATTPGVPSIPTLPAAQSSDKNPVFAFDPPAGTTLQCKLDNGTWGSCDRVTALTGLPDGAHELNVRAVNEAGVTSEPQRYTWTVDTTAPPAPPFVRQPENATQETAARFELSLEPAATALCSVDSGPFVDCTRGLDLKALAIGDHRIVARQTDSAGNVSPDTAYLWKVGVDAKAGAPTALTASLGSKAVVERNQFVNIGCTLNRGSLKVCTVKAYARIGGRRILVGTGRGVNATEGRVDTTVKLRLNATGRRLAKARVNGLPVSLDVTGTPFGHRDLGAKLRSRFYAARVNELPIIWPFDTDESLLTGPGHRMVMRIASQVHKATEITCVGHTDSQGTDAHNIALGLHRARVACAALTRAGVTAKMGAQSWGEARPRATNSTAKGRRLNRRVELIVRY